MPLTTRTARRPIVLMTGVLLALAAVLPAAASATTASIAGDVIRITDAEDENDNITISASGTVTDGRVWRITNVDPGAGCTSSGGGAACDDGSFRDGGNGPTRSFAIDLGDGDDELDYNVAGGDAPTGTIDLGEGDDEMQSRATSAHTITAGPGNDTVLLEGFAPRAPGSSPVSGTPPEPVTLDGGDGDDVLDVSGRSSGDVIRGGAGFDEVSYIERLASTPVTVTLDSTANDGRQSPAEGDDVADDVEHLTGTPGADTLTGDSSPQTIDGGPGADVLAGGPGTDTLSFESRTTAVTADLGAATTSDGDTITSFADLRGGGGRDTLTGNDAVNRIEGGPGDDTLDGRLGADALVGQTGSDTVSYESRPGPVNASLPTPGNDPDGDTYDSIENLRGTAAGDVLRGDGGANRLTGLAGDDVLDGGPGFGVRDTLEGGLGRDRADYGARNDPGFLVVILGTNNGEDTMSSAEDVTGSSGNDVIYGDSAVNDILAGPGSDSVRGGLGADTLNGGSGSDVLSYADAGRSTGVTVTIGGAGNEDVFSAFDRLEGSRFADTLTGGPFPDDIDGGSGADVIRGGAGPDVLSGGFGNDVLDGGPGTARDLLFGDPLDADTADYSARTTAVNVTLRESDGSAVTIDGDELVHIRNVTGGTAADRLVGNSRANVLRGGAGNDRIDGKGGNDDLQGGDGNDVIGPLAPLCRSTAQRPCPPGPFATNPPADGADLINGGVGDDTLSSVDGTQDGRLFCGSGTDTAEIDLADRDGTFQAPNGVTGTVPFAVSCETVRRGARGQHPMLRIRGEAVRVARDGRVRARLFCPATYRRGCRGTVTLRHRGRTLTARTFRLRRSRGARLTLRLGPRAQRLVRRRGRGGLVVDATARGRDTRNRALTTTSRLRLIRR